MINKRNLKKWRARIVNDLVKFIGVVEYLEAEDKLVPTLSECLSPLDSENCKDDALRREGLIALYDFVDHVAGIDIGSSQFKNLANIDFDEWGGVDSHLSVDGQQFRLIIGLAFQDVREPYDWEARADFVLREIADNLVRTITVRVDEGVTTMTPLLPAKSIHVAAALS